MPRQEILDTNNCSYLQSIEKIVKNIDPYCFQILKDSFKREPTDVAPRGKEEDSRGRGFEGKKTGDRGEKCSVME
jgi:hypothetical protein